MSHEILGGTYALYVPVTRNSGVSESNKPFAISGSFKPEGEDIVPFHLLPGDVRSAIRSSVKVLNEDETNSQPHLIKWAFKEAYCIEDQYYYGFIVECLVTKRSVLQHGSQGELFNPTPMMLVSVKFVMDEPYIKDTLPLSTASQTSRLISPWNDLPSKYMAAAGKVTAVINNNNPDLTKHAWGLKGVISDKGRLYVVMEWQHAGLSHIPSPALGPSAPPPTSVTQPPPYVPQS